jgi:hypothetical protein
VIGQIALALNGFQSELAMLFCTVMGGGYSNQFLAIWHALKNDAAQRDILEAAAREARGIREGDICLNSPQIRPTASAAIPIATCGPSGRSRAASLSRRGSIAC